MIRPANPGRYIDKNKERGQIAAPYTIPGGDDVQEESQKRKKGKKVVSKEKDVPIFRYILSDGREIESIDGLVVPYNERTATAYRLLSEN